MVDTERTIYGVTVDALMDSGAKMQFEVEMEMLLYIQENIGRDEGLAILPSKWKKGLA